ncbi:MAG: hypothetical protein HC800_01365 [Phormidesmis sp. RL_2_1]|nr:hypothetical protein [Phormidesmis sp. RL_2_1]
MNELLLAVYILVVLYVLYQMALSLEKQQEAKVIIGLDEAFLEEQTVRQLSMQPGARNIRAKVEKVGFGKNKFSVLAFTFEQAPPIPIPPKDLEKWEKDGMTPQQVSQRNQEWSKERISIQVLPVGEKKAVLIPFLSIDVKNKTRDLQIHLDWDYSSIEMFGQGNRVIRSTSNTFRDLSQPQIFGTVNPNRVVRFDVNIERNYTRDPQTNQLKQPMPLANLEQRLASAKLTDPTSTEKNIEPLYGLDLMVRIKGTAEPDNKMINLLVPFAFNLEIKVDPPAFPPLRWFLRVFGANREKGSWLWGTTKEGAQ